MPPEEIAGILGVVLGVLLGVVKGYQRATLGSKLRWKRLGVDTDDPDGISLADRIRDTHQRIVKHDERLSELERRDAAREERSGSRDARIAALEYATEKLRAKRCEACPLDDEESKSPDRQRLPTPKIAQG